LQSTNLPDPFGICDDAVELRYYKSSYSVSKCRLECQADSLNASCDCKDAHMPGSSGRMVRNFWQYQLHCDTYVNIILRGFYF